ncbi:hypothetical protein NIES39_O02700 [Arthrospira platensis NIES-39]|nr:hypothetical protein AP9108_27750 [Arthrospira sp. PCC 9108]BAI93519.1 hypothetical protein NIES39_O02700 [Arthrospira platensis NIES-39]
MEVRNPTPPSLNDVGFHGVSPKLPRAIAYLSRLGGGNGTQQHHLSVILGFTLVSPNLQMLGETRATKSDRLFK